MSVTTGEQRTPGQHSCCCRGPGWQRPESRVAPPRLARICPQIWDGWFPPTRSHAHGAWTHSGLCLACLGVLEGFIISALFAPTAVSPSWEHRCHIYHPRYVTDDTVLQIQPSARGNSVSFFDAAELLTGCDTKLPVTQQYRSFSDAACFGRAVSVCALAIPFPAVTFFVRLLRCLNQVRFPAENQGNQPQHCYASCISVETQISGFFLADCFTWSASYTSHVETVCPIPSWTLLIPFPVIFSKNTEDWITFPPRSVCHPELYAFLCQLAFSSLWFKNYDLNF